MKIEYRAFLYSDSNIMTRRVCIIKHTTDLGFPFGLPQIIADYVPSDSQRLDEFFRINGDTYICEIDPTPYQSGCIRIDKINSELIYISATMISSLIGTYTCENRVSNELLTLCLEHQSFHVLLRFRKIDESDMIIFVGMIEKLYSKWCEV